MVSSDWSHRCTQEMYLYTWSDEFNAQYRETLLAEADGSDKKEPDWLSNTKATARGDYAFWFHDYNEQSKTGDWENLSTTERNLAHKWLQNDATKAKLNHIQKAMGLEKLVISVQELREEHFQEDVADTLKKEVVNSMNSLIAEGVGSIVLEKIQSCLQELNSKLNSKLADATMHLIKFGGGNVAVSGQTGNFEYPVNTKIDVAEALKAVHSLPSALGSHHIQLGEGVQFYGGEGELPTFTESDVTLVVPRDKVASTQQMLAEKNISGVQVHGSELVSDADAFTESVKDGHASDDLNTGEISDALPASDTPPAADGAGDWMTVAQRQRVWACGRIVLLTACCKLVVALLEWGCTDLKEWHEGRLGRKDCLLKMLAKVGSILMTGGVSLALGALEECCEHLQSLGQFMVVLSLFIKFVLKMIPVIRRWWNNEIKFGAVLKETGEILAGLGLAVGAAAVCGKFGTVVGTVAGGPVGGVVGAFFGAYMGSKLYQEGKEVVSYGCHWFSGDSEIDVLLADLELQPVYHRKGYTKHSLSLEGDLKQQIRNLVSGGALGYFKTNRGRLQQSNPKDKSGMDAVHQLGAIKSRLQHHLRKAALELFKDVERPDLDDRSEASLDYQHTVTSYLRVLGLVFESVGVASYTQIIEKEYKHFVMKCQAECIMVGKVEKEKLEESLKAKEAQHAKEVSAKDAEIAELKKALLAQHDGLDSSEKLKVAT